MFLSFTFAQSQSDPVQSGGEYTIVCGDALIKGTNVKIDTLIQDCYKTMLLQDNAILEIGSLRINDTIKFTYGDTGEIGNMQGDSIALRQVSIDSIVYYDYRSITDVNPKIVFLNQGESLPDGVIIGDHIDWEIVNDFNYSDGTDVTEDELKLLSCDIYDFNARLLYSGIFGDLFQGTAIRCDLSSVMLIIRFQNKAGVFVKKKFYANRYGTGGCN